MTEINSKVKLYQKIAKIMGQVERVPKNGYNSFHKYKYVTESDLIESVRVFMSEEGLIVFNNVKNYEINGELATVTIEFTLACTETGESITSVMVGQGQDKGDKAFYKAYAGATKYFLMKTFLIATGDDPEGDSGVDERNSKSTPQNKQKQSYTVEPISVAQVGMVKSLVKELAIHGKVEDKVVYDSLSNKINIQFADVTDLNKQQASKAIAVLNTWKKEKIGV